MLIEFDLAGAEWVVVAYLSGDPNMIEVVESGKSPHVVTGSRISGASEEFVLAEHKLVGSNTDPDVIRSLRQALYPFDEDKIFLPRSMSIRQAGKKSNHGLNYDMKYRRFALENEMPEADAIPIVENYRTVAYPGIPEWHGAIRQEMRDQDRCLTNCFGRKVRMLGEWGQDLFMAAYSFKPQSTVADVCLKAMKLSYRDESDIFSRMRLGAQVHDSFMVNYDMPTESFDWVRLACFLRTVSTDYMRQQIVYGNYSFKLGCDIKLGVDWSNMVSVKMTEDLDEFVRRIQTSYDESRAASELSRQASRPPPLQELETEGPLSSPLLKTYDQFHQGPS